MEDAGAELPGTKVGACACAFRNNDNHHEGGGVSRLSCKSAKKRFHFTSLHFTGWGRQTDSQTAKEEEEEERMDGVRASSGVHQGRTEGRISFSDGLLFFVFSCSSLVDWLMVMTDVCDLG
jgi:hypothetical protein